MTWLDRLEGRFRHLAIPNLTLVLCVGCLAGYVLLQVQPERFATMMLIPERVLAGEVWRLFTFVMIPPGAHPLWLFVALYVFWLMGSSLERQWGAFRYNAYVAIWWLTTVAAAFVLAAIDARWGGLPTTNDKLLGSVFLAFAFLVPNFQLMLFFLIPVRVKWLALITWLFYGYQVVNGAAHGNWPLVASVIASVMNFAVFFARPILKNLAARGRRRKFSARMAAAPRAMHRCAECGVTEQDDPEMEFRYCSQCSEPTAYCSAHLRTHDHV